MHDQLVACNPFTRHWGSLPPLHGGDPIARGESSSSSGWSGILAFYCRGFLGAKQYLVLHQKGEWCGRKTYGIHTLGGDTRDIALLTAPVMYPCLIDLLAGGLCPAYLVPPAILGDNIYWLPKLVKALNEYKIVTFNITTEMFAWIGTPHSRIPPGGPKDAIQLLEVEGKLAMALTNTTVWLQEYIHIWILNGATDDSWDLRYHIGPPPPAFQLNTQRYADTHSLHPVLHVSEAQGLLVWPEPVLLQCDSNWTLQGRYQRVEYRVVRTVHQINENFKLHVFLDKLPDQRMFDFREMLDMDPEDEDDYSSRASDDDTAEGDFSGGEGSENGASQSDDDDFSGASDNAEGDLSGGEGSEDGRSQDDDREADSQGYSEGEDTSYEDEDDEDQPPAKKK